MGRCVILGHADNGITGPCEPHFQAGESQLRWCKKICSFLFGARKLRKCVLESSIARNSIGNRFPVQKYIGAMVRKSIRVVLVAENDLIEVASDPDNCRFVTEVGQRGLPLYRTTEKKHHLRGEQYLSPAWKCGSHAAFDVYDYRFNAFC